MIQYFIQARDPFETVSGYCLPVSEKALCRTLLNKAGGGYSPEQTAQAMDWLTQARTPQGFALSQDLVVFSAQLETPNETC